MTRTAPSNNPTLREIAACCEALEDKKAENIVILYLGEKSSIADYYIIATGTSRPHLRAIGKHLEKVLKEMGVTGLGADLNPESGWQVIDAHDFIIHVLTEEMREHYGLEQLWQDAEVVQPDEIKELATA